MTKTDHTIERLNQLAISIRERLSQHRKPLLIEISGTPRAGKTTTIGAISKFLRRNNISTAVVAERAQVSPVTDKKNPDFNIWTGITSLAGIISALAQRESIILVDRGIFDTLVWLNLHKNRQMLSLSEFHVMESFFLLDHWVQRVDLVVTLSVDPTVSLERDFQVKLTETPGSIMNSEMLAQYNLSLSGCLTKYKTNFQRVISFDTTLMSSIEVITETSYGVLGCVADILES